MAIDISQRIRKMYPTLSKGHKKLANAVLNEYETVSYLTASQLGNKVGVSESTVVRFASVLGYEGYSEFQRATEELAKMSLGGTEEGIPTSDRFWSLSTEPFPCLLKSRWTPTRAALPKDCWSSLRATTETSLLSPSTP